MLLNALTIRLACPRASYRIKPHEISFTISSTEMVAFKLSASRHSRVDRIRLLFQHGIHQLRKQHEQRHRLPHLPLHLLRLESSLLLRQLRPPLHTERQWLRVQFHRLRRWIPAHHHRHYLAQLLRQFHHRWWVVHHLRLAALRHPVSPVFLSFRIAEVHFWMPSKAAPNWR